MKAKREMLEGEEVEDETEEAEKRKRSIFFFSDNRQQPNLFFFCFLSFLLCTLVPLSSGQLPAERDSNSSTRPTTSIFPQHLQSENRERGGPQRPFQSSNNDFLNNINNNQNQGGETDPNVFNSIDDRDRDRDSDRNRNRGRTRNNQQQGPFGAQPPFQQQTFGGGINPGGGRNSIFDNRQNSIGSFGSNNQPFGVGVTPNPNTGPEFFNGLRNRNTLNKEPRYFVVASKMVRPGQIYRVVVTLFKTQTQMQPIEIRASLLRNGVDIGSDAKVCQPNIPETLLIQVPRTSVPGQYRLRVEGNDLTLIGGTAFVNETDLHFSKRSMTIFIQTDKPIYMQSQTVRFRAIPINTALKAFDDAVDVFMLDPRGNIVRRWLSRQSNFGAVSLNYTLSDQPIYGNWTIRVQALQQVEEKTFLVEEYYQTRFEINVTMPAFFFDTDPYLRGIVVANWTSGGPVTGNLTLFVNVRPLNARQGPQYARTSNYESYNHQFIPRFTGFYEFFFPMWEIERSGFQLNDVEVQVTASVGEPFTNEIIDGYSRARIYNSTLKLFFLGGSPQVFKPSMPYTCYLAVSYFDGSPLPLPRLFNSEMRIEPVVVTTNGGRRPLEARNVRMTETPGIWKVTFDLKQELSSGRGKSRQLTDLINDIHSLRVNAIFSNYFRETTSEELLVVAHYSPRNRHIRVSSSTSTPKVGEYIVFHVRSNFYMDRFTYLIMSKGVILLSGSENMEASIKTFAISVSPEMAPAATVCVYHVSKYMEVVADVLTFPVNAISRNNFTVVINNKKEKTNNLIEVIVRGEPGAFVGLSGLDASFYTMQAGNEISYSEVLSKMINFDEDSNGTLIHKWISREGQPDEIQYFPSHSFAIDANRTFEYNGLVVFSDIPIPRRYEYCNETLGFYSCLTGNQCYHTSQRCDNIRHCGDGTDESNCPFFNHTDLVNFKLYRINRMQRLYENVWLWKDMNIGPHGHFIFTVPVPERPALWYVSALGVSPSNGFGLLRNPIQYSGVRPIFMNLEMPSTARQGEQIGIRVTVFNYMKKDVELMVILSDSRDYKFIHVEKYGFVKSYNPRTSFGEHQHLVWIRANDASIIHLPIVPTKLGKVDVNVRVISQIARDEVTRSIYIEPDGVPQFRHTSVLLDLSNRAFVLQYMHVNVTESPIIPYEFDRYYVYSSNLAKISVVGDVIGPAYPTMPVNASSLLKMPMDSSDQNMFSFAANLYTLMYLRLINQWDKSTYRQAFHHLNVAYQRQLSFQNEDGSFSLFRSDWNHSSPSVWVTSYCARVFAEATFNEWENFLYIDPNVIAKAVSWVLKHQTNEGSFYEVTEYPDRKLNDTITNYGYTYSANVTITAHILIALQAVKDLPGEIGPKLAFARQRAVNYLEMRVDQMKGTLSSRPYDASLVAYALMLSKSSKADAAFINLANLARSEAGFVYWGREPVPVPDFKLENNKPFLLPRLPYKYDSENIEATAYALMVYVARQELRVEAIFKWLNAQRLHTGGWASTQDTAASMRALIDYTILRSRIRDVTNMTITIEAVALNNVRKIVNINRDNLAHLESIDIPNAYGTVKVEARGAGYAILQMEVQYGVDRARFITQPPVPSFSLDSRAFYSGRNSSRITYSACMSWTRVREESERSGLSVLEVNIPTGYWIHQPRLNRYVLSKDVPNMKWARYLDNKVFFYFDYLEQYPTCISFSVERWYPVANMTRYLPMRVYDYYSPERFNETFIDSYDLYVLDICSTCGSYQCVYCWTFATATAISPPSFTVISTLTISFLFIHHILIQFNLKESFH